MPVGFNHPHFDEPEVQKELARAATIKVANSDVYSQGYAEFVETFTRVAGLPPLERYLFIEGGALAIENTLEGGDGLEGAQEHGRGSRRTRHGDPAFPARVPRTQRLHHEPDEHRSAEDGFVREVQLAARFESVASISRCRNPSAKRM